MKYVGDAGIQLFCSCWWFYAASQQTDYWNAFAAFVLGELTFIGVGLFLYKAFRGHESPVTSHQP
jgi:hypothetical protein